MEIQFPVKSVVIICSQSIMLFVFVVGDNFIYNISQEGSGSLKKTQLCYINQLLNLLIT